MDLFKFMKNWTLPLAMLAGVIGYFVQGQDTQRRICQEHRV